MPAKGSGRPPTDRFLAKVDLNGPVQPHMDTACHVWTGAKDKDGYPLFQAESTKTVRGHRWWYQQHKGDLPRGQVVRHRCDLPPCVRLDHLIPGTTAENNRDRNDRGRESRGQEHWYARLTEADVRRIRLLHRQGVGMRPIASELGVSRGAVQGVLSGKTWAHLVP